MDTSTVQDKPAADAPQADTTSAMPPHSYPEFDPKTLYGGLCKFLLDTITVGALKDKGWTKLSYAQQRDTIGTVQAKVRHAIDEITWATASRTHSHIGVTVGEYKTKDELIKCEFSCARERDNLLALLDANKAVLVFVDEDEFMGVSPEDIVRAQPDQHTMPGIGEDNDGEDVIYPQTGEVLNATVEQPAETAEGGIPLDQAEHLFEEAKAKSDAKTTRRRGKKAPETAPDQDELDADTARGRDAFLARQPGIVPDDIRGTPKGERWLDGWDMESVASAKARDAAPEMPAAPEREPADA